MKRAILLITTVAFFMVPFFVFSQENQETLTIVTYYPSPFGVYKEIRAKRVAIGSEYYASIQHCWADGPCAFADINDDATLVVEGNVGIGTTDPQGVLDVKSEGDTDATYGFGVRNSSDNYNIVVRDDGPVGIGTTSPSDGTASGGQQLKLDVEGAVGATHYCDENGENCVTPPIAGGSPVVGTYDGKYTNQHISVGFKPNIVKIFGYYQPSSPVMTDDLFATILCHANSEFTVEPGNLDILICENKGGRPEGIKFNADGFVVTVTTTSDPAANTYGYRYTYMAWK